MNHGYQIPVVEPLKASQVKQYSDQLMKRPFHMINLKCAECEGQSFSVEITGDSFFCQCTACSAQHQLSVYQASTEKMPTAEALVKLHQHSIPHIEVIERGAA